MDSANKLFGRAAFYLTVIDPITSIALTHEYSFFSDERFAEWPKTGSFTVERANSVLVLELVDKAPLAAVTALMRAKRWADAICLMYDNPNFVGWAIIARTAAIAGCGSINRASGVASSSCASATAERFPTCAALRNWRFRQFNRRSPLAV